jgi:hypothetical protein
MPSLVNIYSSMLILECSQGCYALTFHLWPWKSIGFQTLIRTRRNLVYIVLRRVWNPIDFQGQRSRGQIFTAQHPCEHSRINILQRILTKLGTYLFLKRIWKVCTKFGQNPLKDVDSRVFTRMLRSKIWHVTLTFDLENQ